MKKIKYAAQFMLILCVTSSIYGAAATATTTAVSAMSDDSENSRPLKPSEYIIKAMNIGNGGCLWSGYIMRAIREQRNVLFPKLSMKEVLEQENSLQTTVRPYVENLAEFAETFWKENDEKAYKEIQSFSSLTTDYYGFAMLVLTLLNNIEPYDADLDFSSEDSSDDVVSDPKASATITGATTLSAVTTTF